MTPMMEQYFEVKNQYKDYLLFYRLGDFYEMFFDDAILVSRELELTLTGRDCGEAERAPMCGVPFHSAEGYIGKLIEKGYRVAICEQVEDPALAKGLVKREVVRVITPGTLIESNLLTESKNNYICSVYIGENSCGVCFADVSTAEFHVTGFENTNLEARLKNELGTYSPSEIIVNISVSKISWLADYIKDRIGCVLLDNQPHRFELQAAEERVTAQFGDEAFQQVSSSSLLCSIGALLGYIEEMQKCDISYIKKLNKRDRKNL